jgi:pantothenate kinase type III
MSTGVYLLVVDIGNTHTVLGVYQDAQLLGHWRLASEAHRTPDEILTNFLDEWEKIQAEHAAKNPFYKKVIDSQKAYAEQIVPFKLSWFPPYNFAGEYYWKSKIYLKK